MTPNSVIKLLSGISVDRDYHHTLTFDTVGEQTSYFSAKSIQTFTDFTFQRETMAIRVPLSYDNAIKSNYVMFNNTEYSNKWFYGFIDKVEYLNPTTSLIYFTIDVWQSFLFDITWLNCFIEREHVADDTIGANLVDENLDIGMLKTYVQNDWQNLTNMAIVIATTADISTPPLTFYGRMIDNVYSGVGFYAVKPAYYGNVQSYLNQLASAGKLDAIVSIFMFPIDFLPTLLDVPPYFTEISSGTLTDAITYDASKQLTDIDNYDPKNNKLFCYPYNFLRVSNNMGQTFDYHYERCTGSNVEFTAYCALSPDPTVLLKSENYLGASDNMDNSLSLNGYPLCSWSNDVYSNWFASQRSSTMASLASSGIAIAGGFASGNALVAGGGILTALNTIGQLQDKSIEPNTLKGSINQNSIIRADRNTFTFRQMGITAEYAKIIDTYFTMYGYKVNNLKTPNIKTRPHWNYLKLTQANIYASIPHDFIDKLKTSLTKGITFWHDDNIGNYARDNS